MRLNQAKHFRNRHRLNFEHKPKKLLLTAHIETGEDYKNICKNSTSVFLDPL